MNQLPTTLGPGTIPTMFWNVDFGPGVGSFQFQLEMIDCPSGERLGFRVHWNKNQQVLEAKPVLDPPVEFGGSSWPIWDSHGCLVELDCIEVDLRFRSKSPVTL